MNYPITVGLDVGTQGIRGAAFENGMPIAAVEVPLATQNPHPGYAEQWPEALWNGTMAVLEKLALELGPRSARLGAIGIDSTASIFLVDSSAKPLSPLVLWMDVRAEIEAEEIGQQLGFPESAELPWAKAVWMTKYWPTRFDQATYLVEVADWLIWRLTGVLQRNRASALLKWHAGENGAWPSWAHHYAAVVEKLPPLGIDVREPVGMIKPQILSILNIRSSTVAVASPIIDAYAGALGSGAVNAGDMALIVGTSTCELWHGNQLANTAGLWGPFTDIYGLGVDVLEAGHPSTGSVVRWVQHYFGGDAPLNDLDTQAENVVPGSEGVLLRPAFQGIRSPWPKAAARGEIRGLTLAHNGAHVIRAAYEGTAYDIRKVLDVMRDPVKRIVATGGGTRSRVWMSIIADVVGLPIILGDDYAVTRGAAWLAQRCIGWDERPRTPREWHVIEPSSQQSKYNDLYREYCLKFPE